MEWKKIVGMEYGKIVFHSIPLHALPSAPVRKHLSASKHRKPVRKQAPVRDVRVVPTALCGLQMAWAAKRPANEPLNGLSSGALMAQFYLLSLIGPLTNRYQFLKSLLTWIFLLNVVEGL